MLKNMMTHRLTIHRLLMYFDFQFAILFFDFYTFLHQIKRDLFAYILITPLVFVPKICL